MQIPSRQAPPSGRRFASLKTRILFCYIITASLTIALISTVIGQQTAKRLVNTAVSGSTNDLAIISDKLDAYFDGIESYALYMIYAGQWQRDTTPGHNPAVESFTHIKMVYAFLLDLVHANSDFQAVSYYEDDQIYVSDPFAVLDSFSPEHLAAIAQFRQSREVLQWLDLHIRPYARSRGDDPVPQSYSLLRKCYDTTGKFLGIIELSLSDEAIAEVYENHNTDNTSFFILNSQGTLASSTDRAAVGANVSQEPYAKAILEVLEQEPVGTVSDGQNLYVYRSYPRMGWIIVGNIPQQVIYRSSREMIALIWFCGLLGILGSILIFNQVSNHIARPIHRITQTVAGISEGDYSLRIASAATGEVGTLARQINQMASNTQQLMSDIEQEHRLKRQFELSYIQSQMNPHFLYNTLETLCGMIEMGEYSGTIDFIGEISRFYRRVLTRGEITVSLREELAIVDAYLTIMKRRYPGCFEYTISCPDELLTCCIAKLSLQPIVENAIIHGCIPCPHPNHIEIYGWPEESGFCLRIADDGAGMQTVRLQAIQQQQADTLGFGFANTERRLKLQLGESARVEMHSTASKGTEILLHLPCIRKEPADSHVQVHYD